MVEINKAERRKEMKGIKRNEENFRDLWKMLYATTFKA